MNPHVLTVDQVAQELKTDTTTGLSDAEARARLQHYGANELIETGRKQVLAILLDQVKELMVVILLVAAVISLLLHEYIDAGVIFVIVLLNTAIGFWQEFKAENAIAALKKLTVPKVRVRRNGTEVEISAKALVPGDMLLVEAGNIVPADARLLVAANLKVQEAALTGESVPVEKHTGVLASADVALADRRNMLYSGTVVTYGRGQAVVTATGMATELGRIATLLQKVEDETTPLQERLARLGQTLAGLALVLIAVVAGLTLLQGLGLKETFMTAISMAVAAIPEGLPAVVTIALALGAQRMLKKNSLIRHLPAVETLGSVTVICSDKTGTLTQNKMTVTELVLPGTSYRFTADFNPSALTPAARLLLLAGALCNDAVIQGEAGNENATVIGDPTEGALVLAAARIGLTKTELERQLARAGELPFDSERKRMTTVHRPDASADETMRQLLSLLAPPDNSSYLAVTKGSLDGLLEVCSHVLVDGQRQPLSRALKTDILAENKRLAENGIRVLGAAVKFLAADALNQTEIYEQALTYIGLFGMIDPVRPEAVEAVRQCQRAGIRVIMITGDHPLTARAIANHLGIAQNGRYLTGQDLSNMSVDELKTHIGAVSVFARVSPEHKMVLIDALQAQNQIVAMTGDGVNDAPALKSADIGVAMGITGTDVARESSDMVLLDDNFATIVAAVKEGRTIFDNIRKFVKYILTGNTGEIVVMLIGPMLGLPIPLLAIQILWINLVTDGAPAIALGYEEAERHVMQRKPFRPDEGIFSRGLGWQILGMGFFIGLLSVAIGYRFWHLEPESRVWQTMIFTTLTFSQMAYVLAIRKYRQSIFIGFFHNPALPGAVALTLVLQLMLVYVPFFNKIFRTSPLGVTELGVCLAAALAVVLVAEVGKRLRRRE